MLARLICPCQSRNLILWSCYARKPLPNGEELTIQRIRCKICLTTHALIPTLLFGPVRHNNQTVSPYVRRFITQPTTIGKLFNIIAYFHRLLERGIKRHQIWLEITKNHLARMNLDWENISQPNLKLPFSDLPFENDLDITGKRSLHQLIDISISREGSQRLAGWMLQKQPDLNNIQKRQRIIGELIPLTRFRKKLLLNFHLFLIRN